MVTEMRMHVSTRAFLIVGCGGGGGGGGGHSFCAIYQMQLKYELLNYPNYPVILEGKNASGIQVTLQFTKLSLYFVPLFAAQGLLTADDCAGPEEEEEDAEYHDQSTRPLHWIVACWI